MRRESALSLLNRLNSLECYSESSLETLADLGGKVKEVVAFVGLNLPKGAQDYSLSNQQLVESQLRLGSWLKHPKKSSMRSVFQEYRGDFVSVLKDFILAGDEYKLWSE